MGLAQKRIIAEYQEKEFPKWKTKLDGVAGFNLPIDVKWDTIASDDYENRDEYFQWMEQVYFTPLLSVFQNICRDDMGKNALRESLKKISIDGTEGHNPEASSFEGGHLLIKHQVYNNVDNVDERAKSWQKMIERKL